MPRRTPHHELAVKLYSYVLQLDAIVFFDCIAFQRAITIVYNLTPAFFRVTANARLGPVAVSLFFSASSAHSWWLGPGKTTTA